MKVCIECNIEYDETRSNQKYCSKRCRQKAADRRCDDRLMRRGLARSRYSRGQKFLIRVKRTLASCQDCGYSKCLKALVFHHRDPATKSFSIANSHQYSIKKIKAEMRKCDFLCKNCHTERHANEERNTAPQ